MSYRSIVSIKHSILCHIGCIMVTKEEEEEGTISGKARLDFSAISSND
jgi:hypothetical protein